MEHLKLRKYPAVPGVCRLPTRLTSDFALDGTCWIGPRPIRRYSRRAIKSSVRALLQVQGVFSNPGHHFQGIIFQGIFSRASSHVRCTTFNAAIRLEHFEPSLEQLEQLAQPQMQLEPQCCSA
jgi:hypothetical protein